MMSMFLRACMRAWSGCMQGCHGKWRHADGVCVPAQFMQCLLVVQSVRVYIVGDRRAGRAAQTVDPIWACAKSWTCALCLGGLEAFQTDCKCHMNCVC